MNKLNQESALNLMSNLSADPNYFRNHALSLENHEGISSIKQNYDQISPTPLETQKKIIELCADRMQQLSESFQNTANNQNYSELKDAVMRLAGNKFCRENTTLLPLFQKTLVP